MSKILVFGSRSIEDKEFVINHLVKVVGEMQDCGDTIEFISGGASGVDSIVSDFANEYEYPIDEYLPAYDKFGKHAPLMRNEDMAECCDFALCFWDGGSRGSMHTLMILSKLGKVTTVFGYRKRDDENRKAD